MLAAGGLEDVAGCAARDPRVAYARRAVRPKETRQAWQDFKSGRPRCRSTGCVVRRHFGQQSHKSGCPCWQLRQLHRVYHYAGRPRPGLLCPTTTRRSSQLDPTRGDGSDLGAMTAPVRGPRQSCVQRWSASGSRSPRSKRRLQAEFRSGEDAGVTMSTGSCDPSAATRRRRARSARPCTSTTLTTVGVGRAGIASAVPARYRLAVQRPDAARCQRAASRMTGISRSVFAS
jgi:hypothetical protein